MADPDRQALQAHREWLGYVQPVGVVVSPPALVNAQAYVNRNVAPLQQLLLDVVEETEVTAAVTHLPKFLTRVLRWNDGDLIDTPTELDCALPEYGEVLRATYAVREPEPPDLESSWMMLIQALPEGVGFDSPTAADDRGWQASPEAKFERLLREVRVPLGLITNGTHLRLVHAPRGETSGYLTFPVAAMMEVAGRPILAALDMLLGAERLFALPREQRLPAILADSRRYQNDVSTRLAGQILEGLYELLRGFQAADDHAHGELLHAVLREDPDLVYEGLLTVLLRLVFLLYAEDRDLMPADDVYSLHYSVGGLFERLRSDAGRYPDTMEQRYGAWAQLLSVFRIVFDGVRYGNLHLPPRHGHLFDPDRFPFLEGRPHGVLRVMGDRIEAPLVSDGVVWRVLQNLVVLDGERLSYRSLDVEQIGSVYETMMGFRLEIAYGHSLALKPAKAQGAPITINIDELLATPASKRMQWVRDQGEQKLNAKEVAALAEASTLAGIEEAIEAKIDRRATPGVVSVGAMILQPNEERRRSGSFYTPRSLTEPIVRTTLQPIFERLGENPMPEQIFELKVCDPAMGSGAFLVEACRQLADKLVDAWHAHGCVPVVPPDSDELLHARRLVAHRCLYGVDRNPIAVDLAKLSLWLATLARDHPFTFVDHALRCGDSLVGLTRDQIVAFHWLPSREKDFITRSLLQRKLDEAQQFRAAIRDAGDDVDVANLQHLLLAADDALDDLRLAGDLVILSFFSGSSQRERQQHRDRLAQRVWVWQEGGDPLPLLQLVLQMRSERNLVPFHWEIEFPEVFDRNIPGFDAVVGNPPFLGGKFIAPVLSDSYRDYLKTAVCSLKGSGDLVIFFLHRAIQLVRSGGTAGLLGTKTVIQGDTREIGLRALLNEGANIVGAFRPRPWPGDANVHVLGVCLINGEFAEPTLDGKRVETLNSMLTPGPELASPERLSLPSRPSSGTSLLGEGFMLSEQEKEILLASNPEDIAVIKRFIRGVDVVRNPNLVGSTFVIDFDDMTEVEARSYGGAFTRVESLVRPQRDRLKRQIHEAMFWKHWDKRTELYQELETLKRTIVFPLVTKFVVFGFVELEEPILFSHKLGVFPSEKSEHFAVLQSRCHSEWVGQLSSTRGITINYSVSDCLWTFPFPTEPGPLAEVGEEYHSRRARTLRELGIGLTDLYNRFHDPAERSPVILGLRELHGAMDRVTLDAYGWTDIQTDCEFLLDDEDDDGDAHSKSWRYRWPDDVRNEVLARLLALNAERAEAERLSLGDRGARRRSRRAAGTLSESVLLDGS